MYDVCMCECGEGGVCVMCDVDYCWVCLVVVEVDVFG